MSRKGKSKEAPQARPERYHGPLLNKFQVFFNICLALVILVRTIGLVFFGGILILGNDSLYSTASNLFVVIMLLVITLASLFYGCYYLPQNQGEQWTFNQIYKTNSNTDEFSRNFWIAFAVIMIGPVFTGEAFFGMILAVGMATVLPSLVVDATYAAYYVHKYPGRKEIV